MNIIINSEMRVGSRWVHYLLAEILKMDVSPEIDVSAIEKNLETIQDYFKNGRIVKIHHATPKEIFDKVKPLNYKVIGIVRNPRDRIVSYTFHQRYGPGDKGRPVFKEAGSDREAVKIALYDEDCIKDDLRQFSLMTHGLSTRNYNGSYKNYIGNGRYIWTSYEWLQEDIVREINSILIFLGINIPQQTVNEFVKRNSFSSKTGRPAGVEKREDRWKRKGINGDFINWFDKKMMEDSQVIFQRYFDRLLKES